MATAIWWVRRDLRLTDNSALHHAAAESDTVVPVFVIDPALMQSARNQGPRIAWMLDALRAFADDIATRGGKLIIRHGDPVTALSAIAREVQAHSVHFHRDYSPYAKRRDDAVTRQLAEYGIAAVSYKDLVLHESDEIRTKTGGSYSVYTPYWHAWRAMPKPAMYAQPARLSTLPAIPSDAIPDAEAYGAGRLSTPLVVPGERPAREALDRFVAARLKSYKPDRDRPAVNGTAQISPYLRWGMLSLRQAYWAAQDARQANRDEATAASIETWIGELAWRDFYYQVLDQNPRVSHQSYRLEYDRIQWVRDDEAFDKWATGQTGFPIVDAAMRQLRATGWMHNRLRMIVASFLCKDLQIDWRAGERYFMQRLLDGDLASNNGGWQWSAGTGTDAAPYFRIFNPTTQGEKFDPDGQFIRAWVPELAKVPKDYIHAPHAMPRSLQTYIGCIIGEHYPAPIVDHAVQRERTLALYAVVKNSALE
jgi:deoxyribodipyrimidine photo-lyase